MAKTKIKKTQASDHDTIGSKKVEMQEREDAVTVAAHQPKLTKESNAGDEDLGQTICQAEAPNTQSVTLSSSLPSYEEVFKINKSTMSFDQDDKDHIEDSCSYTIAVNAVSQFPTEEDVSLIQPLSPTVITKAQVHAIQEDSEDITAPLTSDICSDDNDQRFNEISKFDFAQHQPSSLSYELETCTSDSLLQKNSSIDILPNSNIMNNYTPASPIISENSSDVEDCDPASSLQKKTEAEILLNRFLTNNNNILANSVQNKNDQNHKACKPSLPLEKRSQIDSSSNGWLIHNNISVGSDLNMNVPDFASPEIPQYSHIIRPKTPDMLISPDDIFSPNTKESIKKSIRALYPDLVPQPVIPVKKRKKGDVPYIVGCTSRRRVPEKPSLSVFKGDKYGITSETNSLDNEECTTRRRSRSRKNQYENWSKSRFNPKSDEIAARLKLNEKVDELLRKSPANETALFMTRPYSARPQAFSPLPSTSKDNETIMKNEKHFNESLNYENNNYDDSSVKNFVNYDNNNYDIGDDEELPEVILDLSDTKKTPKKNYYSLLQSKDYEILNKGIPIFNEDMNNNNDDGVFQEYDFSKIKIKKYTPETVVKRSHSPSDDNSGVVFDLNLANNKSPEIIDTIEINDDYENHLVNKTAHVIDVESVVPVKKTSSVSIIELPDVVEPSLSNKSSATKPNEKHMWNEDVEFISETPVNVEINSGTRNELSINNNENITAASSNNDIGTVVNNFFSGKNTNNNKEAVNNTDMTNELRMLFTVLTESCTRYLAPKKRKRFIATNLAPKRRKQCITSNIKKQTLNKPPATVVQPEQTTDVNNENAAPSANAQLSPANGERRLGDCPICMENLSKNFIASTTCGHVFCLECIETCLVISGKRCPTCRKRLKGTGYHQVFL